MTKLNKTLKHTKRRRVSGTRIGFERFQGPEILTFTVDNTKAVSYKTHLDTIAYLYDKRRSSLRQSRKKLQMAYGYKANRLRALVLMRDFAVLLKAYGENNVRQAISELQHS